MRSQPAVVLVIVQVFFAGNGLVSKMAVKRSDPVFFCFCRDVGAALLLLFVAWWLHRATLRSPRADKLEASAAFGVNGVAGGMVFFVYSLQYITPLNASLCQPLQPVLVLFLSVYPFRVPSGLMLQCPPSLCCFMELAGLFVWHCLGTFSVYGHTCFAFATWYQVCLSLWSY